MISETISSALFGAMPPVHASHGALVLASVFNRMLIGARNLTLCPIYVFRHRRRPRHVPQRVPGIRPQQEVVAVVYGACLVLCLHACLVLGTLLAAFLRHTPGCRACVAMLCCTTSPAADFRHLCFLRLFSVVRSPLLLFLSYFRCHKAHRPNLSSRWGRVFSLALPTLSFAGVLSNTHRLAELSELQEPGPGGGDPRAGNRDRWLCLRSV